MLSFCLFKMPKTGKKKNLASANICMSNEWVLLGRYHAPVLCQSYFAHSYQPAIYTELNVPLIKYGYDILEEEVYLRRSNVDLMENFFYSKTVSKDFAFLSNFTAKAKTQVETVDKTKYDFGTVDGFKQFTKDLLPVMTFWILVHYADPGIEKALKEKCAEEKQELYAVLAQPNSLKLELFEKDRELEALALNYRAGKLTEKQVNNFLNKYAWTSTHAFLGRPLTKETLIEQLNHFEPALKPQVKKTDVDWPELQVAADLQWLRLRFMEVFNKVTYKFWPLLEKIAEEHNLDFEDVTAHSFEELIMGNLRSKKECEQRREAFGITIDQNGREHVITGQQLQEEKKKYQGKFEMADELNGFPASPGTACGSAKLVLAISQMNKVQKGDILIASETTPDYVPAMKIAGAIVTDQGGVTSHAAIVSRELGVPCVIGTKIATKVFKDGDLLEVDAIKGVVKKVS